MTLTRQPNVSGLQITLWSFRYREGAGPPKSIWGFFKPRSKKYYAPINHKKIGKEVRLEDTSPYTAMKLNLNPLMAAFS